MLSIFLQQKFSIKIIIFIITIIVFEFIINSNQTFVPKGIFVFDLKLNFNVFFVFVFFLVPQT